MKGLYKIAIQKSGERTAAKVFGIANASMAVFTTLTGLVFLIIYAVVSAQLKGSSQHLLPAWVIIYNSVGWGGLFGGLLWCVFSWFTLKTIYTSTNRTPMIVWACVNLLFIFPIPLFVLMIIIAKKECQ